MEAGVVIEKAKNTVGRVVAKQFREYEMALEPAFREDMQ